MPAPPLAHEELLERLPPEPILPVDGQSLRVNFSAEVAGSPEDAAATTPKALLTAADARLLAAKCAGRGRCVGED